MQKRAILQVRIEEDQKAKAERLYRAMGTTLSEAVRLFVAQSNIARKLPFQPVTLSASDGKAAHGALAKYGNKDKRSLERDAWINYLGTERELRDMNDAHLNSIAQTELERGNL